MLTKAETKRLSVLQSNYEKAIDAFTIEKLNICDLLLLLRHDEHVREIIRDIVHSIGSTTHQAEEQPEENHRLEVQPEVMLPARPLRPSPPPARVIQQPDELRTELAPELRLLNLVTQDTELARAWLGEQTESQGRQLVRLIAVASQWSQIQLLWDRLAERCRTANRPATPAEQQILETSLTLHNLVWDGLQARFEHADIGAPFDHDCHERGTRTGDIVRAEWLPSLFNAAGHRHRKTLVAT
jgi:hypothetical protein